MQKTLMARLFKNGVSLAELVEHIGDLESVAEFLESLLDYNIAQQVEPVQIPKLETQVYADGQPIVWDGMIVYEESIGVLVHAGYSQPSGDGEPIYRVIKYSDSIFATPTVLPPIKELPDTTPEPDQVFPREIPLEVIDLTPSGMPVEPPTEVPMDKLDVPYLQPHEDSIFYMDHRWGREAINMQLTRLIGSTVAVWHRSTQDSDLARPVVVSYTVGILRREDSGIYRVAVANVPEEELSNIYIYPKHVIYIEQGDHEDPQRIAIGH